MKLLNKPEPSAHLYGILMVLQPQLCTKFPFAISSYLFSLGHFPSHWKAHFQIIWNYISNEISCEIALDFFFKPDLTILSGKAIYGPNFQNILQI